MIEDNRPKGWTDEQWDKVTFLENRGLYSIIARPAWRENAYGRVWLNGYAYFPEKPLQATDWKDKSFTDFIPSHGGINYLYAPDEGGATYGFDTNHLYDDDDPLLLSPEHVAGLAVSMAEAILVAPQYEARWLALPESDKDARWAVIDEYNEALEDSGNQGNMSVQHMLRRMMR